MRWPRLSEIEFPSSRHHGWDGNLDIVNASDYVTVSYTRFSYTGRSGGHQFSNLVGSGDGNTGDTGHLRVTWYHDWWANRVVERQPRVRFGQNHLFNNPWSPAATTTASASTRTS